ncbi:MAG: choice-of-anchor Q domain-containing protein [Lysobacterales bacterium]
MLFDFRSATSPGRPVLRAAASVLLFFASIFLAHAADAATYYVRTDGGSAAQCTGLANVAYSGSGSGQACAWSHPFIALPPAGNPARIAGGDTLIIGHGSYMMGYGAPETGGCYQNSAYDCIMQTVPSGLDATHPTRILGEGYDQGCPAAPQLWGTQRAYAIVQIRGTQGGTQASNIEVGCLEMTDHSSCIENHCSAGNCTGGADQIDRCRRDAYPFGTWAENGLIASDASNVLIHDLNIHGLGAEGVRAGRLTDWTIQKVRIWANGFAGWDADIRNGVPTNDTSYHGTIHFTNLEIAWSGCGERYPSGEIFGCWDQNEGGYGDGFGAGPTGGTWIFEDSHIHHNVSDGLDLLYGDATANVTYRRVKAEDNAGNQLKASGNVTIENSIVIGTCAMPWSVSPVNNYDGPTPPQYVGRYNMELSGNCRASGDSISLKPHPGNAVVVRSNTITGQGNCQVMWTGGDATSTVLIANNAIYGGNNDWLTMATGGGNRLTCGIYAYNSPATLTTVNNLLWHVRNDQCPTGSHCTDPGLSSDDLASFDPLPLPNSPLINNADAANSPATDYRGVLRPALGADDIGAIEYRGLEIEDPIFNGSFD